MKDKDATSMAWILIAMYQIEQNEGDSDLVQELKELLEKYTLLRRKEGFLPQSSTASGVSTSDRVVYPNITGKKENL